MIEQQQACKTITPLRNHSLYENPSKFRNFEV